MSGAVRAQVTGLLEQAHGQSTNPTAVEMLRAARERIAAPLRVAIAGKIKAGKSTLLNALVGELLAPTDAGECTRIVTWYRDGLTYRVLLHPRAGEPVQVPFTRTDDALVIRLDGHRPDEVERLEVEWPAATLRTMTLIDTPGIGSLSTEVSQRTHAFLVPDDRPGEADAVCYLMRHLHQTDARFLEAFHDDDAVGATPMNAIGILSRADEIGVGKLNALEVAGRIAHRYRTDPRVRRLCQTVLPVAGLLAETGATLREDEHAALTALVAVEREQFNALLLSADRFASPDVDIDVDADTRRALLARLGVFGIRVSSALIRSGQAPTATRLSAGLIRRSGIAALRETLATQFAARADLLKARSGLAVLSTVLGTYPQPGADRLLADVERVTASTHAFAEARLLNALRAGTVALDDADAQEAERLLGGHGDDAASRLGLDDDVFGPGAADDDVFGPGAADDDVFVGPAPEALHDAAMDALSRWRRRAEHPMASRAAVETARLVVRSCEGIIAALGCR